MSKIWIIIQREYISRVKKRAFIITTLLAPLGFLLFIASSFLINSYSQSRTDVAIVDETGLFKDAPPDAHDHTVYFHLVTEKYDDVVKVLPKEKDAPAKYQAIIHIPANFDINEPQKTSISYLYTQRPGFAKLNFLNKSINTSLQQLRMKMRNVPMEEVEKIQQEIKLNPESLNNSDENQAYTDAAAGAGFIMGFAIYISLFFYGTMIMKGVMEEKTNRIVEVLTSSVKPFQLLMGKIIGIGGVGLTQFILWILLTFLVNLIAVPILASHFGGQPASMGDAQASGVDPDSAQKIIKTISALPFAQIAIFFPIYFLGGFLLYGSLFAAIGAAMGEDSDQQSLMFPITIPIIISFIIAINVINNPDSNLGFWASIVPLSSPVVMCALLPFRPEWWQIGLSILLLIAGFVFTTWIAARIYRVGILMYGKKASLAELAKWVAKG